MTDVPLGSIQSDNVSADNISIVPNWSIQGSNNALAFLHNNEIKNVISKSYYKDYYMYYSSDYTILNQSSYFIDKGVEITVNIAASLFWQSLNSSLSIPLPTSLAKSSVPGRIKVSWAEGVNTYSTQMAKCYINSARNSIVLESSIFKYGRTVTIDASITYILEQSPNPAIYTF